MKNHYSLRYRLYIMRTSRAMNVVVRTMVALPLLMLASWVVEGTYVSLAVWAGVV